MTCRNPRDSHSGIKTAQASASVATVIDQALARFAERGAVFGLWDLGVEPVSLGGLLVLRQELEQLAAMAGVGELHVFFRGCDGRDGSHIRRMVEATLHSEYEVKIFTDNGYAEEVHWPPAPHFNTPDFSYQFFDRVVLLYRCTGKKPVLRWSRPLLEQAAAVRRGFPGKLVAVHLKQVSGKTDLDSNADQESWHKFFSTLARPGIQEFVLLGLDQVSPAIRETNGIHLAREMGLPLSVQLALISVSDGFLGMASGICPAAILSNTPYVAFKNPLHHVAEMNREIGSADCFPFASPNQRLWRILDSPANLNAAFNIIN